MTETEVPASDPVEESSGREVDRQLFARFSAAALGGLTAGFVVGGLGGRLAMFVLRLTSSDSVRGIESDDGFTIGRVTTESIFLLAATTLLGALLAFGYLLVRRWLPERRRPLQAALFFGLVGASAVIKPEGIDFNLLGPLWLAVVLFIALPTGYGWLMATLVEALVDRPSDFVKVRVAAVIVFAVVGFFGLFAVGIAVAAGLLILVGRRWPALADAVVSPVPTWIVRVAILVVAVASGVALTRDVAEIL
jgi:MFS family permease